MIFLKVERLKDKRLNKLWKLLLLKMRIQKFQDQTLSVWNAQLFEKSLSVFYSWPFGPKLSNFPRFFSKKWSEVRVESIFIRHLPVFHVTKISFHDKRAILATWNAGKFRIKRFLPYSISEETYIFDGEIHHRYDFQNHRTKPNFTLL